MIIYSILVLALAIPLGYWLAWLAKDELVAGRKWLISLSYACAFAALAYFMFFGADNGDIAAGFTIIFIGIISYIAHMKSFDGKWTRKRSI